MRASTMLRALALCGLLSAPSAMRSGCGVSHWSPAETVVQTQAYGASPPAASASASASDARAPPPPPPPRGLQQTQVYTGTAFDYPAAQAAALGLLAPLRLVPVYDVIQAGDENSTFTEFSPGGAARRLRQCNAVGQDVWVVAAQSSASESTMTCGAQHIVTGAAGAARYATLVARTEAVRAAAAAAIVVTLPEPELASAFTLALVLFSPSIIPFPFLGSQVVASSAAAAACERRGTRDSAARHRRLQSAVHRRGERRSRHFCHGAALAECRYCRLCVTSRLLLVAASLAAPLQPRSPPLTHRCDVSAARPVDALHGGVA